MTGAHLHLMFIHFPIAGMVLALPVLLAGWWLKNEGLKWAGLFLVVAAGLATGGAFFTGEAAEEIVEKLPGIAHEVIHAVLLSRPHGEGDITRWKLDRESLLASRIEIDPLLGKELRSALSPSATPSSSRR